MTDKIIRNIIICVIIALFGAAIILYWLYLSMEKEYGSGDFIYTLLGLCGILSGLSILSYINSRSSGKPIKHWSEQE